MVKNQDSLMEELRKIFVSFDIFNLTNKGTNDRIQPLEKIVYGFTSLVAIAVLTAILSLVIRK